MAMTAKEQFQPKSPTAEALGQLLRQRREAAGKTIHEVYRALGCSLNRYRMGEAGASPFRADEMLLIARFLEINVAELLAIDPAVLDEPGN